MLKTHLRNILGRDEEPDPFGMQIACEVIRRRGADQPISVKRRLAEAASDYAFHARQLIEARGLVSPFAADPDETGLPAEILLETEPHLLLGQRILKPQVGMEIRVFCLRPRNAPQPPAMDMDDGAWLEGAQAFMELVQHPDGRWQVLYSAVDPAVRRQGIATRLYDCVEQVIGRELAPSGWLSDDAYRFWQNRGHWTLDAYRQIDHFNDLWLSFKAIVMLSAIARVSMESLKWKMN